MEKRPVAHPAELPIIQPPLEIIKECHIREDKWYILILSGGYGLTRQHLSISRLELAAIYRPSCLILAPVGRVDRSVADT